MQPDSALGQEARYLHRCFFGRDPDPEVIERYIAANMLFFPEPSAMVNAIVIRELDAEAIELALRFRTGPSVLTRKIQTLFYLLEVRSVYYPYFVGGEESRPRAMFGILGSLAQTGVKYVKGEFLVRRHGFV